MNNVGELVWTLVEDEDQCHWAGFEEWGMRLVRRPCQKSTFLGNRTKLADLPVGAGGDF